MNKKNNSYNITIVFLFVTFFFCVGCKTNQNISKKEHEDYRIKRFAYYNELLEGVKNKNSGKYEEALESYIRAMRIAPNEAVSYYEIATVLAIMEDYTTALQYADKACKLSKNNYFYQQLKVNLYQSLGKLNEAAKQYNVLIKLEPESYKNYYEQANLYIASNNYKEAKKSYDKAEKQFGVHEYINIEKYKIAIGTNNIKLANKEINKLIKAYPNDARYLTMLAEMYIEQKKYKEAETIFNKIEKMDITNGLVFMSLAEFYRVKNNIDKTFYYLNLAFESEDVSLDNKVEILYNLMNIKGNEKITNYIYGLLETVVNVHAMEPKAHVIYSDYLVRDSKWKEAQEQLELAIKTEKSLYPIWDQILYIDAQLEDYEKMLLHSTEAMQYFPMQVMIYMYNTVAASNLNKPEEVIASAKIGIKYSVGNNEMQADFFTYLAEAYHKLNLNDESDSAFEEVLKRFPENTYVLNNYSYYLAVRNEKINRAVEMSEQLIRIKPGNANYLDTYAWVLFRHKNFKEAKRAIEKAIENDNTDNPTFLEHYGDILFFTNEIDKAVEYWQKALDADSKSKTINEKIKQKKYIEEQ